MTLFIKSGSPWENGYLESYNCKLRDELLNREIFHTLLEVKVLTKQYRQTYNRIRPRSSLGYRPPYTAIRKRRRLEGYRSPMTIEQPREKKVIEPGMESSSL